MGLWVTFCCSSFSINEGLKGGAEGLGRSTEFGGCWHFPSFSASNFIQLSRSVTFKLTSLFLLFKFEEMAFLKFSWELKISWDTFCMKLLISLIEFLFSSWE